MPYWYFDKKDLLNSPSYQDGIDHETESRYRKEGARFIIDTGSKMDLGYNTVATGVVYFHRFYMFHSFRTFPRYITACCCLFLAGKVEETPKKCKDIIKQAKSLLTEQKFATFGEDPKEEVMTLERILLQTIKFDLQVEHPYSYLLKYAKCLKGDKVKLQKMVQMAWTFVNDSLCTTLSLQWEPEVVAVALMFLAGKLSKFEVVDWAGRIPKHQAWWDMFVEDITMDLLEDICHQVLDLYSPQTQKAGAESPVHMGSASARRMAKPPTPPTTSAPSSRPASPPPARNGEARTVPPLIAVPAVPVPPTVAAEAPRPIETLRFPFPVFPGLGATTSVPPPPRPPLLFPEPPPPFPPVNVPPPNYFPPGPLPHAQHSQRPYYPPPQ